MFDQIFISQQSQSKRWMSAAFTGQVALITLALMTPLFFPEAIRVERRFLGVVQPPNPPPPPVPEQMVHRTAPTTIIERIRNLIPIPNRDIRPVNLIVDPPPDGVQIAQTTGPCLNCVPGAVPGLDPGTRIIGNGPPPPAQAVKEPEAVKPLPLPAKPLQIGGQVLAAKAISRQQPIYPPLARQARIQGVVKLHSVIAKDGTVQGLRVISGHPLLVPAAVDAVRRWTYHPTLLNGQPVEVEAPIEVNFILSP